MFAFALRRDDHGIDLGAVITQALRLCAMQHKEAWILCDIDGAQWSRGLHGHAALDLWKLLRLPYRFWFAFWPLLLAEQTRVWLVEFLTDRQRQEIGS